MKPHCNHIQWHEWSTPSGTRMRRCVVCPVIQVHSSEGWKTMKKDRNATSK